MTTGLAEKTGVDWLLEGFRFELESTTKPSTVDYYCGEVQRFLTWAKSAYVPEDFRLITKAHILAFFHHLLTNGPVGDANMERRRWPYYRALRRFFSWSLAQGYMEHDPMDGIKLKTPADAPVEPYRPEHIERMMAALDSDWQCARTPRQRMLAARDRAILCLFLESGLRLMELVALRVPDVDVKLQRIMVRGGKMGKGRLAGFGTQTKRALWRYIGLRFGDSQALWLSEEGKPLTRYGVKQIIRRLKHDAGLQHVSGAVHRLRHTFATSYLRHTRDMKGCRILLGHSTLAMTERYTQVIDAEDVLQAYKGQGPLDWIAGKDQAQ